MSEPIAARGAADSKRLVVIADDFGRNAGINDAVAEAFDRGILTGASLMAGGMRFDEAVDLAQARPGLSVGLHVTLCDGRSVLPPSRIPGLVDEDGSFEPSPARAGLRYWTRRRKLGPELAREIEAQFERATNAGLALTHVDGHHHLHVHPVLFDKIAGAASRRGVRWIRNPSGDVSYGAWAEWAVFGVLGRRNRRVAKQHGLSTARKVFGLSRTGRIEEAYVLDLLPRLTPGWNELFLHPDASSEQGRAELQALTSPRVRDRIAGLGIVLSGYGNVAESNRLPEGGPA